MKEVLDTKFNSSIIRPSTPGMEYYNSPNAHVIDQYRLLNNNCAVMVSKALNAAGSNVLKGEMLQPSGIFGLWKSIPVYKVYTTPLGLQNHMKGIFYIK